VTGGDIDGLMLTPEALDRCYEMTYDDNKVNEIRQLEFCSPSHVKFDSMQGFPKADGAPRPALSCSVN
jgi:hypothetical protein